jgi:hypothetical protein
MVRGLLEGISRKQKGLKIHGVRAYICAEWHLETIGRLEQGNEMTDCGND